MLDFRMDTFLTVCETMNFTRAADLLGLTQPAVSQHIHVLEEQYGVKLFDYRRKKLTLTAAGELVRDASRTMRHDEAYLKEKLQVLGDRPRPLNFGATLTVAEFALPGRLAAYLHAHPDRDVRLVVGNTQELLAGLDRGTLDFALVEGYFPGEITTACCIRRSAISPSAPQAARCPGSPAAWRTCWTGG